MPSPPKDGESRDDFIGRCVPVVLEDGTAKDQDQAVAICSSMYEDGKAAHAMGPSDEESESDWMGRCVADMTADGKDEDEAMAACEVMWQHHQERSVVVPNAKHLRFVELIKSRQGKSEKFGYGITTAEPYVRALLQMEESGCKIGRTCSVESLLKEAQSRLCCSTPYMTLESFSTAKDISLGRLDGVGVSGLEPPPKTLMLLRHVVTTDKQDREGDVLETSGFELDPAAPLLWQHQPFLPIGKVLREVEHTAHKLTVISALLDMNELTHDAAVLFEADALRFSHGFRVLDYDAMMDEKGAETGGFRIKKSEGLEVSGVSVPSNTDAVVELWSRGKFESDVVRSYAKSFADKRPLTVAGVDITLAILPIPDVKKQPVDYSQLEMPISVLETLCPECGKKARAKGFKSVKLDKAVSAEMMAGLCDVVGGDPGFFTRCMEFDFGEFDAQLSNREGFCNWLHESCGFGQPGEHQDAYMPSLTKAGRVISQKNMDLLGEVRADLEELSGMEMARASKALCERCASKVQSVIESAKPTEEVATQDAIDKAITSAVVKQAELTDVVNFVLGASQDDLARVKHTLDLVVDLTAYNAAAEDYRAFEKAIS